MSERAACVLCADFKHTKYTYIGNLYCLEILSTPWINLGIKQMSLTQNSLYIPFLNMLTF